MFLQTREKDTPPAVSAFANLIQEMAAKAISSLGEKALFIRRPRQSVRH